jgi:hypothetical protein
MGKKADPFSCGKKSSSSSKRPLTMESVIQRVARMGGMA